MFVQSPALRRRTGTLKRGLKIKIKGEVKIIMGKGDKRTRRGKIFAGSFGKTRPKYRKKNAANVKPTETKTEE
jgi:30S ribosomal protein S31